MKMYYEDFYHKSSLGEEFVRWLGQIKGKITLGEILERQKDPQIKDLFEGVSTTNEGLDLFTGGVFSFTRSSINNKPYYLYLTRIDDNQFTFIHLQTGNRFWSRVFDRNFNPVSGKEIVNVEHLKSQLVFVGNLKDYLIHQIEEEMVNGH